MKTVDSLALQDHLAQQVTGLVTCWEIERVDGKNFYFTDADEDLTVDNQTYSSIGAYKRTAIETTSTLSVDNLEVVGLASDLALPAQELRNGLFDNARVSVFMAAWSERVPGKIRLRRGFFGEVQTLPNETFQVELRGLLQRLSYNYMDIYSATCLYDLGEPSCGIVIKPDQVRRNTGYSVGDVVVAAQSNAELSLRYDLEIGDPDFSIAANIGDFSTSEAWYNSSALGDMILSSGGAFSPPASIRGSGSGNSETLTQIIDIETATDLPIEKVIAGEGGMALELYRKNESGDLGRVNVDFRDEDGVQCTMGYAARSTQGQRYTSTFSIAGDFTVSFWIYPDDNSEGGIMTGGTCSSATLDTGSDIVYENQTIRLRANFQSEGFPTNAISTLNEPGVLTKVFLNQWNHVAITRAGTELRIYINFELMALVPASGYDGPFFFEDLFDGDTEYNFTAPGVFDNGALDDVRIYNVAKTYDEIVLESKNDPVTPDANLLRWFSFDDNTINDQTGNDATNYGAGTGVTYPVSLAPFNSSGYNPDYSSGNNDVGSAWVRVATPTLLIPPQARQIRIRLTAVTGGAAFFDNLRAVTYDLSQQDTDFLPDALNDVYWRCTVAGTTASTYPATFVGGTGTDAVDGGVTWRAENAWLRGGRVTSSQGARVFSATISDPRAVDAWFQGGTVIFSSGENAGAAMEVKSSEANGNIELFLSVPANIAIGDQFLIYPGCDKSRISCAAIFDNMINFFGFPDIPGQDALYAYPNSKN